MLLGPDEIQGRDRGNPDQFMTWVARSGGVGPFRDWVETVTYLCDGLNLDRSIVWFQGYVETGGFQNAVWQSGRSVDMEMPLDTILPWSMNPDAGIDAAQAHVAILWTVMGKVKFTSKMLPARKVIPNFLRYLTSVAASEHNYPPVIRLEDLNRRYTTNTGGVAAPWTTDRDYIHKIVCKAMAAPVQIPNQIYWHPTRYYPEAVIARTTYETVVYEGPSQSNRVVERIGPGQRFRVMGEITGHAARGIPKWYALESIMGYVHSYGIDIV